MSTIMCRGVRGATTASADTREAIMEATSELLRALIEANDLHERDVASVIFTTSPDLTAEYPALAARLIGWTQTALLGCQEIAHPRGIPLTIRVLIHWNTTRTQDEITHVYLREAVNLRPDLLERRLRDEETAN